MWKSVTAHPFLFEFQEIERSNAWKCVYIQKPAVPIFSRVRAEKNHHPVVVFLIINDSPASSNFEKQTRKTLASPDSLSPSQSLSQSVSFSLLMFKFSGENDLTVTFSKWKQSHLVSRVDSKHIAAYWGMREATCHPDSTNKWSSQPSYYLASTQRRKQSKASTYTAVLMHLSSA